MSHASTLYTVPAVAYTIRLQGEIDPALVDWFGPVTLSSIVGDDGGTLTTLTGRVADQAALVGLIRHLHGLGVVLLAVQQHIGPCAQEER